MRSKLKKFYGAQHMLFKRNIQFQDHDNEAALSKMSTGYLLLTWHAR